MDVQKQALSALKDRAEKAGLNWVESRAWANTGKVYLQRSLSFETRLSFAYRFDPAYGKLQWYRGKDEPVATCGFTHENCVLDVLLKYHDMGSSMQRMFELIEQEAAG